jgi:hypothetical protein
VIDTSTLTAKSWQHNFIFLIVIIEVKTWGILFSFAIYIYIYIYILNATIVAEVIAAIVVLAIYNY